MLAGPNAVLAGIDSSTALEVGYLGSAEGVSAVAEVLSDYPDVPLVAYLPNLAWVEEDEQQAYLEAFRDLVLPQTEVLVGSHQTLADFLREDCGLTGTHLGCEHGVCGACTVLVDGEPVEQPGLPGVGAAGEHDVLDVAVPVLLHAAGVGRNPSAQGGKLDAVRLVAHGQTICL